MSDAGTQESVHEDLLYSFDSGIAWITLNRPDAANALTPDQRNRLIQHFDDASADLNVRVVVLTANGKHFCTGSTLGSFCSEAELLHQAAAYSSTFAG